MERPPTYQESFKSSPRAGPVRIVHKSHNTSGHIKTHQLLGITSRHSGKCSCHSQECMLVVKQSGCLRAVIVPCFKTRRDVVRLVNSFKSNMCLVQARKGGDSSYKFEEMIEEMRRSWKRTCRGMDKGKRDQTRVCTLGPEDRRVGKPQERWWGSHYSGLCPPRVVPIEGV